YFSVYNPTSMKPEILIVEDNPITSEAIGTDLKSEGYRVQGMCASGEAALELLQKKLPDLVLMDIRLEGHLNGIQVAEQIKKNYNLPIIYLTDVTDPAFLRRAKDTVPSNYLTKPFQTHQLLIAIELALSSGTGNVATEFGFFRSTDKEEIKVNYRDILFLKSDKMYCDVILKDKKFTISQPMKTVHKRIPDPDIVRVEKSYCINKNHIDKIIGHTIYIGNEPIPVGKTYRQVLSDFNFIK
ncbi:MAG: response regulator, partial [Bacteroidota bacterium]